MNGLVSAETDFKTLIANMLGRDDHKLTLEIAEECCRKCGGLPGKCTCVDDVLSSTEWTKWPSIVVTVIADTIAQVKKRAVGVRTTIPQT